MTRTSGIVAVLALVATVACTDEAAGDQIEKKLLEIAKGQGLELKKVTCPKSIKVEVKGTFACKATTSSDKELTIVGTITSKSGKNFEYSIEIVEPPASPTMPPSP